ncbi:hypothetical protein BLA29_008463, partial [Euroglyphus maynei]
MNVETFELKNDDEDEDDDEVSTPLPMVDINFKPVVRKPVLMAKTSDRSLNVNRFSNNNPRFIRQNFPIDSDDSDDDSMIQLGHTLPGVPGEDYPIFSSIPRTKFNCIDHKWPGYYADIDTHCQVFHICQNGGRKDSFLCPNGTMFNQQLFTCDWWHNVQCDQISMTNGYELNAQIYNNNPNSLDKITSVNGQSIQPLK